MTASLETDPLGSDADVIATVPQPTLALDRILATQPELFINVVGQPTIRLSNVPERSRQDTWPLRSDRVKAWIAEFMWDQSRIVLAEREIDRIVTVLIGRAWHDQRYAFGSVVRPCFPNAFPMLTKAPVFRGFHFYHAGRPC